ncbi:MAG: cytochrome C [Rhodobacterales bacterium]|nr:MAG: cytochrome C [Rhodobacterales bacterium]
MNRSVLFAPLIALAAACQPVESPDVTQAAGFYADNCTACHGADGRGNGEMAAHLITPPQDLTTLSKRNGGTFPRDYVMSTIDGYQRGEHFSAAMPEFGVLDLGETVIVEDENGNGEPVPAMLLALTDYLESIQAE